jgi:hypothetical protein
MQATYSQDLTRVKIIDSLSPKRKELFGLLGVANIRTLVDRQNPRRVAVMMHVLNMDALNAVMQSPAAAEAMAHDGHPGTEASRSTGLVQQAVAVEPALIDVT